MDCTSNSAQSDVGHKTLAPASAKQIRLSLAAFARSTDLYATLDELRSIDVHQEQILVGMLWETMGTRVTDATSVTPKAQLALLHRTQPRRCLSVRDFICTRDPEAWNRFIAMHIMADNGPCSAAQRQGLGGTNLIEDLDNGSTIVIVRANSFPQHRRSVSVLLKLASSKVLTHDFVDRRPPSLTASEYRS